MKAMVPVGARTVTWAFLRPCCSAMWTISSYTCSTGSSRSSGTLRESIFQILDDKGKRAVVGCVKYFYEPADAVGDFSKEGLVDDVELVNFVIALTRADIPLIETS